MDIFVCVYVYIYIYILFHFSRKVYFFLYGYGHLSPGVIFPDFFPPLCFWFPFHFSGLSTFFFSLRFSSLSLFPLLYGFPFSSSYSSSLFEVSLEFPWTPLFRCFHSFIISVLKNWCHCGGWFQFFLSFIRSQFRCLFFSHQKYSAHTPIRSRVIASSLLNLRSGFIVFTIAGPS